jgi:Domain of unknown function (DUF6894)
MPLYYFVLKNGCEAIADEVGLELPNLEAARAEAVSIARELMRNCELARRAWKLEVCDDYLIPRSEVLFAEADETIAHLQPQFRSSIESMARKCASLGDAFHVLRASLADVRKTMARTDEIVGAVSKSFSGDGRAGERR